MEDTFGEAIYGPIHLSVLVSEIKRLPVVFGAVDFEAAEFDFANEVGAEGHGGHDNNPPATFTKEGFGGGNGGARFTGAEAVIDEGTTGGAIQAEVFANELLVFVFLEGHLFTCLRVGLGNAFDFEIGEFRGNETAEEKTVRGLKGGDWGLDFVFGVGVIVEDFLNSCTIGLVFGVNGLGFTGEV
jgi:hypothetical protein